MQIWVDADACPVVIREILCRVATRTGIKTCFVANQYINIPRAPCLSMRQVEKGFDVADNEIVKLADAGDLVITSDIPLAAEVIAKGALALSPRGELLTADNVRPRLNMRDFMDSMRDTLHASGVQTSGPPPLGNKEKQQFANHLDRIVAKAR